LFLLTNEQRLKEQHVEPLALDPLTDVLGFNPTRSALFLQEIPRENHTISPIRSTLLKRNKVAKGQHGKQNPHGSRDGCNRSAWDVRPKRDFIKIVARKLSQRR
jgi:hypothetical protein